MQFENKVAAEMLPIYWCSGLYGICFLEQECGAVQWLSYVYKWCMTSITAQHCLGKLDPQVVYSAWIFPVTREDKLIRSIRSEVE